MKVLTAMFYDYFGGYPIGIHDLSRGRSIILKIIILYHILSYLMGVSKIFKDRMRFVFFVVQPLPIPRKPDRRRYPVIDGHILHCIVTTHKHDHFDQSSTSTNLSFICC